MLRPAWALLAPPLCGICCAPSAASEPLCPTCSGALERCVPTPVRVAATDWALAATPYSEIARAAITALKFRGRLAVARPIAAAIAVAAGSRLAAATIVPVPPAPRRRRRRGFDPADEIATALSQITNLPILRCLRRVDGSRQLGRARHQRLASPPRVRSDGEVPHRAVVIDDVVTTSATLTACAVALRLAGACEVGAVAFARA
jgi:ComF family protein